MRPKKGHFRELCYNFPTLFQYTLRHITHLPSKDVSLLPFKESKIVHKITISQYYLVYYQKTDSLNSHCFDTFEHVHFASSLSK